MQRRLLTALLYLWFVALAVTFGVQVHIEDGRTREISYWIYCVPVLSVGGAAIVLTCAAAFFVLARAIASAAVRRGRAPLRKTVIASLVVIVLGFAGAAALSRVYWGYWFRRPQPSLAWWGLDRVSALGEVRCSRVPRGMQCRALPPEPIAKLRAWCADDPYYCLEERLPLALHDAGMLARPPGPLTPRQVAAVERALASDGLLVRADPGYTGDRGVSGYAAAGTATLAVAVEGGELSNDHYPMYELVADPAGNVLRSRVFFWDFAGIEGLKFPQMLTLLLVGGYLVGVPVALMAALVAARRARAGLPPV